MTDANPGNARTSRFARPLVVRRVLVPAGEFLRTEAGGGVLLLLAAITAVVWANSPWDESYFDLLDHHFGADLGIVELDHSLHHWINDGLMAIFFFVVGLEIKREVLRGELASVRRATLPAAGAIGGMVVPALIFVAFNLGGDGARGWGIPMATDIAFAVGVMALLGNRIPFSLKIFLLALAIVDDLGAILVIALFYTEEVTFGWLLGGVGAIVAIFAMERAGVRKVDAYIIAGIVLWLCVHESGIHATLAGVILGLLTPAKPYVQPEQYSEQVRGMLERYDTAVANHDHQVSAALLVEIEEMSRDAESPLDRLEHMIHPWSSYIVIPLFALANAGLVLSSDIIADAAGSPITWGIGLGLVAGKLFGIMLACFIAVRLGLGELPEGTRWSQVAGAAILAGIGFTVSLFITELAFSDPAVIDEARIGIFVASIVAGIAGFLVLRQSSPPRPESSEEAVAVAH